MREKLIELLCEAHSKSAEESCFNDATYAQQLGMEADHLIANGVTVQKWIPVTERLPEKDDRYATVCNFGNGVVSRGVLGFAKDFSKVVTYQTNAKDIWYEYDREYGFVMITYVTHWMPLPEPPKD